MFKIRVSCVVACEDEFALIHRLRESGDQYTLPGGNVESEEDLQSAIIRELREELGLTRITPEFLFLQDMLIHRSDREGFYRKLHVIFRVIIPREIRTELKTREQDDLGVGEIRWVSRSEAIRFHLYPNIGKALAAMPSLGGPITPKLLPPLTDQNYTWR